MHGADPRRWPPALQTLRRRYLVRRVAAAVLLSSAPIGGLLASPFGFASGMMLWPLLAVPLLCATVAAWRANRTVNAQLSHWLDDHFPAFQDSAALLSTTAGPSSALASLQRERIARVLATQHLSLQAALPAVLSWRSLLLSAGLTGLLVWLALFQRAPSVAAGTTADAVLSASPSGPLAVHLQIVPPAYTGLPTRQVAEGDQTVPDGSQLRFCLRGNTRDLAQVTVHWLDGESRALQADTADVSPPTAAPDRAAEPAQRCASWVLHYSTGYRVLRAGEPVPGLQGRLQITIDEPPQILFRQPERELQDIDSALYQLAIAVDIRDDYGLQRASLHWTLARGGGENVRFTDREQRLPAGADPRHWLHEQLTRVRALGMEPGDELYFYLSATDNRQPAAQQSRSRTYILRHPATPIGTEAGARLPADLGKAKFRSQRQIILDTEALIRQRPQLPALQFRERSEKLAQDQMILRLRYGEFLGEESSFDAATAEAADTHDGHEGHAAEAGLGGGNGLAEQAGRDVLQQFGHAHDEAENATLFDEATKTILRRALRAMWAAEGSLRLAQPEQALAPEYTALDAIKALQQAERIYLHKTAFTPPPLEPAMRFTGEATGLRPVQRQHQTNATAAVPELRQMVLLLDRTETPTPVPVTLTTSVRQWLQQQLRAGDDAALTALDQLQRWQSGCASCREPLRDQLLQWLPPELPRLRIVPPPNGAWHARLQAAAAEQTP